MYRRLIYFGLAVCATALIALVVPLALASRDIVQANQLSAAAAKARAVANEWQQHGGSHGDDLIPIPVSDSPGQVTLFGTDDEVVGPDPPQAKRAVAAAFKGGTASDIVDGSGYVTAPAYFDDDFGVVLVSLTPQELRTGLLPRLGALAGVSLILLAISGGAAWWLARLTVAPLRDLERTANEVAGGDLTARAPSSSITEIEHVGVALNRLTGRVQELLDEEREYTAELAHQLRTPLTVLSVDVDAVDDPEIRERLDDDLASVHQMVDEIINTARRSSREGLHAKCDAAAVVGDRVQFWQVLAEDQGRAFSQSLPARALPVRLTADDLASALDILFQNVFLHTDEGVAFGVEASAHDGFIDVTVWDRGRGFSEGDPRDAATIGSTRLGLSIARRLSEASGGALLIAEEPSGGARVTLRLGPPGS
ncbi:MAG: HAMP domain-containing histidine kinase [Actinobacteria bacterium]|jgi:signal transduction histidine kinase|nr:HAMP domain-containing histidine kinase [Actinomycetota bacterium]MCB9429946.1 HAMP domain-containing histidine kinase [Actinomycetota bacterium]MCO5301381.1 HAMP domain-containing histidine kinase [Candidatus Nanopelagicales bacterium]HPE12109.1 HAMP domain-containing sensor histidine kinase [Actinomycetota bacterium]